MIVEIKLIDIHQKNIIIDIDLITIQINIIIINNIIIIIMEIIETIIDIIMDIIDNKINIIYWGKLMIKNEKLIKFLNLLFKIL